MALNIGRKGRLYVVQEAVTYGLLQDGSGGTNTLSAAANAVRHIDFKGAYDPFNRVNSSEKKTSPGQVAVFDRRTTAGLGSLQGLIRPSGTLNTLPEATSVFEAAFGAKTNVTIAATVLTAASTPAEAAPTTTAFAITDIGTLAVGDAIQVSVGGKLYGRFITAIAAAAGVAPKKLITIAPALPAAPVLGGTVKGGITYKLTTDLSVSLAMLHCLSGFRRELRGIGVDKLALVFDANAEGMFTASGPASKQLNDAAAVADPTTFTTVGGNPPSGIIGECYIGNTSYLTKKSQADLTNGLLARNVEYGGATDTGVASEIYRSGRRAVNVSLDAFVETAATLHDFAVAGTQKSYFKQTGRTSGNIIAVYCPKVDWKVPDTDNPDSAASWAFKGTALESSDGANDEIYFALL